MLDGAGYDRTKKTLFIWEGVTFYLTEEAVDSTLRFKRRGLAIRSDVSMNQLRARYVPAAENQASDAQGGGARAAICTAYVP